MKYVGRTPDADYSVTPKNYVDSRYGEIKVDTTYINGEVAAQSPALVTPAYVNSHDALRAQKTAVQAADTAYLPLSQVNQASGLVGLDGSAYIDPARLPTVQTERKVTFVQGVTTAMPATRNVSATTGPKEFQAGVLNIPDPGYPYVPMIFAQMQGGSVLGASANRGLGTGSFGQITVLRHSDDLKYSWCLCTSHVSQGAHTAIPFADNTVNPASRLCTGANTFDLWIGLWSGTTYTFTNVNFNFYAIVYPGL